MWLQDGQIIKKEEIIHKNQHFIFCNFQKVQKNVRLIFLEKCLFWQNKIKPGNVIIQEE